MDSTPGLSIIIPALNECGHIGACLRSVSGLEAEVVVVDGGSHDGTPDIAREYGATVVTTAPGRGIQLRAGGEWATGRTLLFLHADSRLSEAARHTIGRVVVDPEFAIGTFRLRFDAERRLYRFYSWFTRFDSIWTSFGDQGILVRREFYHGLGGFHDWPLLEDVDLLRRARGRTCIVSMPAEVMTSARRFEREGEIRQQLRNALTLIRYLAGADPYLLARSYGYGVTNADETDVVVPPVESADVR